MDADTPGQSRTGASVQTDPDLVGSFLTDAAHVPGGFAAGVAFPRTVAEIADIVGANTTILPVGAQSSLTGGATPRGEVVLSTRALNDIAIDGNRRLVRAGAGVSLKSLQHRLADEGLWYPPAPTYDGASVGGTASTNAAGAATFKYGTTRSWVHALTVVLANGTVLSLARGDVVAVDGGFSVDIGAKPLRIPRPTYQMPDVPKLSAGYFAKPGMDLVDLFVGAEGTLGVIADVTLRVVPMPERCVALIACTGDQQALRLTNALREQAQLAWRGMGMLDVSAIEFMDARSLAYVADSAFAGAGIARPTRADVLLLIQLEVRAGELDAPFDALDRILTDLAVTSDPILAVPGDGAGASRLFALREAVPAAVNATIAAAKQQEPMLEKTAGDFIVPFATLDESLARYRHAFEARDLEYAIWGHVSDGNLHPNVIPRSRGDMDRAKDALIELARQVIAIGGSPLAEHGVGRSPLKQQLLRELYGDRGIDEMRAVKTALDPHGKLSPGVLFPN